MSDVRISLDLSGLVEVIDDIKQLAEDAKEKAADLAAQTHLRIKEEVQRDLHSRRDMYDDALSGPAQVADGVWVITLDKRAVWIEEGMPPHSMVDDLLKNNARTAADGCVLNPRNKVLTSLGWKKIKDVAPGDLVLTHSGKFREVKDVLVRPAGVGTEYVRLYPLSDFPGGSFYGASDVLFPAVSLTVDHPVLTPSGWRSAGELKKGDLVATPADLRRRCGTCGLPLPINVPSVKYCLNNCCSRVASIKSGKQLGSITPERRREISRRANDVARRSGCFDRPDWGARNPNHLYVMRKASASAMRERSRDGKWEPEVFFEKCLTESGVSFRREVPVHTDRVVNAGRGRTRRSVVFLDFFFPALKLVIELDGKRWHSMPGTKERDAAKDAACRRDGYRMLRVPSHRIYRWGPRLARHLSLWSKNHSGELGVAWVRLRAVKRGVVTRPDHVYSKKYDLCLDADEHSFCCETMFVHNSLYKYIPFNPPGQGPARATPSGLLTMQALKTEMKKRNIPYKKVERHPDGSPKTGLLHKFDVLTDPLRPAGTAGKPGYGKGPEGEVMQGPGPGGQEGGGTPWLAGVRVFQSAMFKRDAAGNMVPDLDKMGRQKAARAVMTFRTVSSKHRGIRWNHPGVEAKNFFERAEQWALREWEQRILPELLKKYGATN